MEKLVFHQTISFHVLFFSCGLTCLEIKNIFFHFMFVILAHFEKPKKHKWNDTYFFHEFSCFFWLPKPKNQTPSRGNKKTEKKWGKTKKQLFYLKQYFLFQQMFFFFSPSFFWFSREGVCFCFLFWKSQNQENSWKKLVFIKNIISPTCWFFLHVLRSKTIFFLLFFLFVHTSTSWKTKKV